MASWGKNVFVLWEDDAIQHKSVILLKQSIDNGTTFGPAIDLSDNNTRNFAISFNPEIATVDNNLYIKFQDIISGILLKKSTDAGISFGPATILTNSTAVSHRKYCQLQRMVLCMCCGKILTPGIIIYSSKEVPITVLLLDLQ